MARIQYHSKTKCNRKYVCEWVQNRYRMGIRMRTEEVKVKNGGKEWMQNGNWNASGMVTECIL